MIASNDTIIAISGSSRIHSSNGKLLNYIQELTSQSKVIVDATIHTLPLFSAAADCHPWPVQVLQWRKNVAECNAIIICTPEYLHNLPASIKNALEWLTSSGELNEKPVLPITFTPSVPRGEKAMQSLLWSLEALNARIVAQLDLYQTEIKIEDDKVHINELELELITGAIELLVKTNP